LWDIIIPFNNYLVFSALFSLEIPKIFQSKKSPSFCTIKQAFSAFLKLCKNEKWLKIVCLFVRFDDALLWGE